MARYKVAPTKTNLFRIRREDDFARQGHQLLEQKREILVSELMSLMDIAQDTQRKADEALKNAYHALEQSIIKMGHIRVNNASMAVNISANISIRKREIIGVDAPVVDVGFVDNPPYYSLKDTSFWLDESVERFKNALEILGKLAELKITVLRIAREVNKTARRVNALEKIYLPDYRDTIKYISDVLEEQDRETFFVLKLIKTRLQEAEGAVK